MAVGLITMAWCYTLPAKLLRRLIWAWHLTDGSLLVSVEKAVYNVFATSARCSATSLFQPFGE